MRKIRFRILQMVETRVEASMLQSADNGVAQNHIQNKVLHRMLKVA